jgi:hypothetical protein
MTGIGITLVKVVCPLPLMKETAARATQAEKKMFDFCYGNSEVT